MTKADTQAEYQNPVPSIVPLVSRLGRKALLLVLHLIPTTRCYRLKAQLLRLAGYDFSPTVRWVSTARVVGPRLRVGSDTFIGHDFRAYGSADSLVDIAERVDIGPQVVILAGSHELGSSQRRAGVGKSTVVTIGAGTWVGGRVTIVGPAEIGEGCMIAAGTTVRGVVPENSLYLGFGDLRPLDS